MSVEDLSNVNSVDQWKERILLPTSPRRSPHTFWEPDQWIKPWRSQGGIEWWWTSLVLPHLFVDADRAQRSDGNCPRSVSSQRSGSHACPRWIPQRLPCRGLRILGLAYPAATDKHPSARCCHLAAVQRLQVQGPPEKQREFLRRGGCFAGGTVERIFHYSGELSGAAWWSVKWAVGWLTAGKSMSPGLSLSNSPS